MGSQRSFVALVALMGTFLIPIFSSSLRGLTHILTCEEKVESPFTMIIPDRGPPQVLSSTHFTRGQQEGLCGGLLVDLRGSGSGIGKVKMTVVITNKTSSLWEGTVDLLLKGDPETTFPVNIGRIPSGQSGSDVIEFKLKPGTHDLGGSLLLGP